MVEVLDIYRKLLLLMLGSKKCMVGLCSPHELTPVQGILLIILEPGKSKNMNELSEWMGCDASNITGLIDRLESHDFIVRTPGEKDRRVKMIGLTKKGEDCRAKLMEGLRIGERIDLERLTPTELQTFSDLLDKIAR